MRHIFLTLVIITASMTSLAGSNAADGCGYDQFGRFRCAPGAQPGVPYFGNKNIYGGYSSYGHYAEGPRYYRRGDYDRGYNRRTRCPPNYTIQDGVCKPYRGY
jgi:hypothetical protein